MRHGAFSIHFRCLASQLSNRITLEGIRAQVLLVDFLLSLAANERVRWATFEVDKQGMRGTPELEIKVVMSEAAFCGLPGGNKTPW